MRIRFLSVALAFGCGEVAQEAVPGGEAHVAPAATLPATRILGTPAVAATSTRRRCLDAPTPSPAAPARGVETTEHPTLQWQRGPCHTRVRVELCLDEACKRPFDTFVVEADAAVPQRALPIGQVFWRLWDEHRRDTPSATAQFVVRVSHAPRPFMTGVAIATHRELSDPGMLHLFDYGPKGLVHARKIPSPTGLGHLGFPETWFGRSIARAGDIDNDGFEDLLVGAPLAIPCAGQISRAYVYFGGDRGHVQEVLPPDDAPHQSFFGQSVAAAGDLNGDGFHDVVIGAPANLRGGGATGLVYIYYGSTDGLSDNPMVIESPDAGWVALTFGTSVDAGADATGDGYPDILVGAGAGAHTYLLLGPDYTNMMTLTGSDDEGTGMSVAFVGDVDGDGIEDIAVGAPYADENAGRVYLTFGGLSLRGADVVLTAAAPGGLGTVVAGVGDINGDGFADLAAGAPDATGGGTAQVYLGGSAPLRTLHLFGRHNHARFGMGIAGLGDIDDDGADDFVVTAPGHPSDSSVPASAALFYGVEFGRAPLLSGEVLRGERGFGTAVAR